MPDILHLLTINASPECVYQALSTPEGVRQWWTREADLDLVAGGKGEFRFSSYGNHYSTRVEIAELVPSRNVAWHVVESFRPEWVGTTISFDLQEAKAGTTLRFAQQGVADSGDCYALCTTGWAYYLVSLQQYLETGKGAPSPDIDFARMLLRP